MCVTSIFMLPFLSDICCKQSILHSDRAEKLRYATYCGL